MDAERDLIADAGFVTMNPDELRAHLLSLERSLHRPEIRQSFAALERLLAPEFSEIGRSGRFYDRPTVVKSLLDESDERETTPPDVSDVSCIQLGPDCALLIYRSSRASAEGASDTLRSSVWKCTNGQWTMAFHQGIPAATAAP